MSALLRDWLDPALAVAFLLVCGAEVLADGEPFGVLVVAGMSVALVWRRSRPLLSASVVMASVVLLSVVADLAALNTPQLLLFVAPYSVAAHAPRPRAVAGLGVSLAAVATINLTGDSRPSSWVFSVGVCAAAWATGLTLRSRRDLAAQLARTSERIAAEREGRELLAIAEQRTRIAGELQELVASSVSTMVVQTQAAQRLLGRDAAQADAAMATIEETGRQALAEMRRILGVLRHDDAADLAPQPGLGQVAALVEQARRGERDLVLQVEGEPGPLPASVDLGVYRILEDVLSQLDDTTTSMAILLRFGAEDIELAVTAWGAARLDWPTLAMRERVALCQGQVEVDALPGPRAGERLVARLPRAFEGALEGVLP